MTGLRFIMIKLTALSFFLLFFLGVHPEVSGYECDWNLSKIEAWDKAGNTALIQRYLSEQIACLSERNDSSAPDFLKELSAQATKSGEASLKGCVLEQLGHYYSSQKDYPAALHYLLEEVAHWAAQNNNFERANALLDIADLYGRAGNFPKEHTYLLKAYAHYAGVGLKGPLGTTASRLGFYHKENAQHDSAFFYLEQAQVLQREVNDLAGLVYTINHLGRIYKDKGNGSEAKDHYRKALDLSTTLQNRHPESWTLINLGFLALEQLENEKAKSHFERAKRLAEQESMPEILRLSFEGLYRLAEREKDFANAYRFYRRYQELGAHYKDNRLTSALAETEWRYQQELLQKELDIDRLQHSKDRLWKALGAITSIFLLTTLGFTWFFFTKKVRKSEREKQVLDLEIEKYSRKNSMLQERIAHVQRNKPSIEWNHIEHLVQEQYPSFKPKLLEKHPQLSEHDLRFCMLLLTSFSTKEIAGYFNISPSSANKSRYRLRKKLGLSREENLLRYLAEQI